MLNIWCLPYPACAIPAEATGPRALQEPSLSIWGGVEGEGARCVSLVGRRSNGKPAMRNALSVQ